MQPYRKDSVYFKCPYNGCFVDMDVFAQPSKNQRQSLRENFTDEYRLMYRRFQVKDAQPSRPIKWADARGAYQQSILAGWTSTTGDTGDP